MTLTAKILRSKDKKLATVGKVRAAIIAILEDIESGDATIAEATPIKKEIQILMRKLRAQMKSAKPKDKAALKSFFGK
jgi:hypothetical protein